MTSGRLIKSFDVAATFSAHGVTAGAEYRNDRANTAVVRTDFTERERYRLRAGWAWKELVRVSATAEQIDVANDDPGVALDGRVRRYGGDVDVDALEAAAPPASPPRSTRRTTRRSSAVPRTSSSSLPSTARTGRPTRGPSGS